MPVTLRSAEGGFLLYTMRHLLFPIGPGWGEGTADAALAHSLTVQTHVSLSPQHNASRPDQLFLRDALSFKDHNCTKLK